MFKKILKSSLGVVIGGVFLYLTLKNKPIDEILKSLSNSNLYWIAVSSIALLTIFYIRALRWKVLLDSNGYQTSRYNVVYSLVLGYLVNSFTPKLGEIIRCTSLNKQEQVPVAKSLGTVVSERVYDVAVLMLGVFIIILLEISHLGEVLKDLKNSLLTMVDNYFQITVVASVIFVIFLFFLYKKSKNNKLAERVLAFFKELLFSMKESFKMKNYTMFIVYTVLIWGILIFVNYSMLRALPETSDYSVYFATMVLFIGGIGWALPSPGGIGTTNFIILQLFIAYNLDTNVGVSFGLLASGITFAVTVGFGLITVLFHFVREWTLAKTNDEK